MKLKKLKDIYNEDYSDKSIYVIKTALTIFVLCLFIYYIWTKAPTVLAFAGAVVKPLILGMCIAYLLNPLALKIDEKLLGGLKSEKTRKTVSVLISFAIAFFIIGVLITVVIWTFTKSISALNFEDVRQYATVLSEQFNDFRSALEKTLKSFNINIGSISNMLGSIFSGVKTGASTLLFSVIFAVYFMLDSGIRSYWMDVFNSFASDSTREKLNAFAKDAKRVFSGYIRGQAIDACLVGIMVTVALLIAGIPYAAVIGILTGVGNLIPYVGPVVGFGSLIVVCLAEGSLTQLLIGGVILLAVMFIDGNIINPRMLSSNVEVHPVLVIVALLVGGKIGGVVGMLISVPVAALIKIRFEKYMQKRKSTEGINKL